MLQATKEWVIFEKKHGTTDVDIGLGTRAGKSEKSEMTRGMVLDSEI